MLKLIKRKTDYWYIRGTISGKRVDESTGCKLKTDAEKYYEDAFPAIRRRIEGEVIRTYGAAAEKYILDHRSISKWEALVHRRIQDELRDDNLKTINQATINRVASALYKNCKASTRNRWVVRPISAVMHYAENLGYCGWVRFKKFREEKPKTRAVSRDIAIQIIAEAGKQEDRPKIKYALCLWMFKHGNRISEILSVKGPQIHAKELTFELYISKSKRWKNFSLDTEVLKALKKAYPEGFPEDGLFPWKTRWGVYKWLLPMCRGIGITFSPHMARHSIGTWFAAQGESVRTTMERLGHDDMASSMRYQAGDIEIVRQANQKIGNLGGTATKRRKKC